MKPLNRSKQSQRLMRWSRYGTLAGLAWVLIDLSLLGGGEADGLSDPDARTSRLLGFALVVILSGLAGGLLAMIANWFRR